MIYKYFSIFGKGRERPATTLPREKNFAAVHLLTSTFFITRPWAKYLLYNSTFLTLVIEIYLQIANVDAGVHLIAVHTFTFEFSIFFSIDSGQRPFIVFSFLWTNLTQDLMQVLHKPCWKEKENLKVVLFSCDLRSFLLMSIHKECIRSDIFFLSLFFS